MWILCDPPRRGVWPRGSLACSIADEAGGQVAIVPDLAIDDLGRCGLPRVTPLATLAVGGWPRGALAPTRLIAAMPFLWVGMRVQEASTELMPGTGAVISCVDVYIC